MYYQSGRPRNAISVHPTDPWAQQYDVASFFYADGTPAPRGTVGTTDDTYGLDAMVKYDFRLAGLDLNVRLDIFNLFDSSAVRYYSETAGPHPVEPTRASASPCTTRSRGAFASASASTSNHLNHSRVTGAFGPPLFW